MRDLDTIGLEGSALGARVETLVPRKPRPIWLKPDVLVLSKELPSYVRGEKGFRVLTDAELDRLASASRPPDARRRPIVAVEDLAGCTRTQLVKLSAVADKGVPVVPLADVVQSLCRLTVLDGRPPPIPRLDAWRVLVWRMVDVLVSVTGLLLLLLVLPFVAAAIWLEDRGPIFYAQKRVGLGGRPFFLYKVRSMECHAEGRGPAWSTTNDCRVTRVGSVLRRTRIDELPQFFNILRGDMSLLGPRPERPFFVELLRRHVPYYDLRHLVRPGLTGWATVKVGYGNSIEAKYLAHQFDLYHLRHRSFRFDLEILARSAVALLGRPEMLDRFMT